MAQRLSFWQTSKRRLFSKFPPLIQSTLASVKIRSFSSRVLENHESKGIDFEILFDSCTNVRIAKRIHALLLTSGKALDSFIFTRLVNIYAHVGDMDLSYGVFYRMHRKDAYTWNSMISGYVRNGHSVEALSCLYEMLSDSNARPDFYTFPSVLKTIGNKLDGLRIHCWIFKLGLQWDVFVASALVHMYCRFGCLDVARKIFDDMPFRDMGCWNAVISGFCQYGNVGEALDIVDLMTELEGMKMDAVTITTILAGCAQIGDFLRGLSVHLYVIKHGLEDDVFVSNGLINIYAKFSELRLAQRVFDQMLYRDLVSWNSIVAACEQNNYPDDALRYFYHMHLNGFQPDLLTLVSLASSIAQTMNCLASKSVHGFILRRYSLAEDIIGNAIIDMYAKLGIVDSARNIFEEIPRKDVVSWNTMISGYSQNGLAAEAVEAYCMMKDCNDITPNQGTWVAILPAYAHLGALREGMRTHGQVVKAGLELEVFVATSLIDLYGKCGRLGEAMDLFHDVAKLTSAPWNAMISCHGIHGHGTVSLQLFMEMLRAGVKPDPITFLSVLAACSHSGLVNEGKWCFDLMQQEFGIKPSLKHYGCMVDLLARAGQLETAYGFIQSMPLQPDASIWGALLGACRIHGNMELGRLASDHLFEVDVENVGYYILLSNIYATSGVWQGVNDIRSLVKDRGLKKTPGWSSIELRSRIEVFYTGNQSHPMSNEIYKELQTLNAKIKSLGYTPDYSFVLQDVEEDEKEQILTSHSERLAIAYGILNSPPKTPIHIFKNLRVCGDCHNVTKLISKITEREIIVRDSNRFHRFKDGICSCGDYW